MTKSKYLNLIQEIKSATSSRIQLPSGSTYNFIHYSFGERGNYMEPKLISEISDGLVDSIKKSFDEFDYLIAPEPGGHLWGLLTAYRLNKPINIMRITRDSKLFGETLVRKTAYNKNHLMTNIAVPA